MRTSIIQIPHPTKQRLLDAGLAMLLEHGYNDLGIQALLAATATPKGSFYHHFKDKEDFALRIIDQYMTHVHAGLDACLDDSSRLPLERVRRFFELTQRSYRKEGYMGCLLGGLGQELSGVSERFRRRIEACFSEIAVRIATCLEQAKQRGDIPADPIRGRWPAYSLTAGRARRSAAGCAAMAHRSKPCWISISIGCHALTGSSKTMRASEGVSNEAKSSSDRGRAGGL